MLIVAGPASHDLAARLDKVCDVELVGVESKIFPDGESYIRFTRDVAGEDVAIVQTTFPNQDRSLMQLFLMADDARSQGCRRLFVIAPYLAYMRQDQRFRPGEALSIQTIANILSSFQVEKILSVDVHNEKSAGQISGRLVNLSAAPLFVEWAKKRSLAKALVFAPDSGGSVRARLVAENLRTDWAAAVKQRNRATGAIKLSLPTDIEVEDRKILIVDDVISTGGSMAELAGQLVEKDAGPIYALATHALLIGDAQQRLADSGIAEVAATDTVPSPVSTMSVAKLLAEAIARST